MLLARPAQVAAQGGGLFLLVAIQHFHASSVSKALLVAAVFIGLLASPVALNVIGRRRLSASRALSLMLAAAAIFIAIAGAGRGFGVYFLGIMLGVPLINAATPMVTAIWRQNVPSSMRGRLFSMANSASGIAAVLSSLLIAAYLGGDPGKYRVPVLVLAVLLLGAAVASYRTPSKPIARQARNPLSVLAYLWRHREFGMMSAAWMLAGLSNLTTLPLRTEYVASGDHIPALPAWMVLLITAALPQATALVTTIGWGLLFDRVRFPVLRVAINACFLSSVVVFFGPALWRQVLGSFLLGLGQGGGLVTWNLWVTKYAPAERTADYMAVHTFLTGLRGVSAPLIAYAVLDALSLMAMVWLSVALNLSSIALLVLIIVGPAWLKRPPSYPPLDEPS